MIEVIADVLPLEAQQIIQIALEAPLKPPERAALLLKRNLTRHQQLTLREAGFFYVLAKDGRWYALHDGYFVIVLDSESGLPTHLRGIHPKHSVPAWHSAIRPERAIPTSDALLAQLLLLRTNPALIDSMGVCMFIARNGEPFWTRQSEKTRLALTSRRYWTTRHE